MLPTFYDKFREDFLAVKKNAFYIAQVEGFLSYN